MHDEVNYPKHDTQHTTFNLGNAINSIWRPSLKDSTRQDLEKAKWYTGSEVERLKL